MHLFLFSSLILFPFTLLGALAQGNNNASSSSNVSQIVSTTLSTGVISGSTFTTAFPVTLSPSPSGNSTGNSTNSTSSNTSNSTSSSPTSTKPLPTAPTDVNGGGDGPGGAPSPGQSAPGGIYGPPDGYVSGVTRLQRNAVIVSLIGVVFGALLSLL